jgi:hypothetical protein
MLGFISQIGNGGQNQSFIFNFWEKVKVLLGFEN